MDMKAWKKTEITAAYNIYLEKCEQIDSSTITEIKSLIDQIWI